MGVAGDLSRPGLGVEDLAQPLDHVFHLAAVYDVEADEESSERANVDGTRHVIEFVNTHDVGRFHHVSSIAVAGDYRGVFQEDMFDEGQGLPHHYHRTKYESERLVREGVTAPTIVFRPGIVVGDSETGEMDKVDGPYYFFKLIQKLRHALPEWVPLAGPQGGQTNIVPVDFVARAMDHIAHLPDEDLPSRTFHLVNPEPMYVGEALNEFARAAHAPQLAMRVDQNMTNVVPAAVRAGVSALPTVKRIRNQVYHDLGIPPAAMENRDFHCRFDARDAQRVLSGTGIAVPPLSTYAPRLWDYWERNLDPDLFRDRSLSGAIAGKRILITGASSGIGLEAALKVGEAGGEVLLVSRTREKLEEVATQVEERGGTAHVHPCDLSDLDDIDRLAAEVLEQHGGIDVLVNNAGRSIRRSVKASYDRFHDYERTMRLNYYGALKLILAFLPGMRERRTGPDHQRLVDRRADQHAALLGLRRLEGGPGRLLTLRGARGDRRQREVHHHLHAAGAHAHDRAHRHLQGLPHAHARRGRPDAVRRHDRQAQADGLGARDLRRGPLRRVAQDGRHRAQHGLQPVPRLQGRRQGRRGRKAGARRGEEVRGDVHGGGGHGLPPPGRSLLRGPLTPRGAGSRPRSSTGTARTPAWSPGSAPAPSWCSPWT